MILMYHKVAPLAPSRYWVTTARFRAQMEALRERHVVPLSDYDPSDPAACVITFDDAYLNVLRYAAPILRAAGYPFEVFVNGGLLGQWNRFDTASEPPAQLCDAEALAGLVAAGGRLQWHTLGHVSQRGLRLAQAMRELCVPSALQAQFPAPHFQWFSYPYGHLGGAALMVARARFEGAVAVDEDASVSDRHRLPRFEVTSQTEIAALDWHPAAEALPPCGSGQAAARQALAAALARGAAPRFWSERYAVRTLRSLRAIARPLIHAASTRPPRHQSPPATREPSASATQA